MTSCVYTHHLLQPDARQEICSHVLCIKLQYCVTVGLGDQWGREARRCLQDMLSCYTALQLDVSNKLEGLHYLQGAQLLALSREEPCCLVGTACH